jgi:spore germination cell wall hydrolase CwlJ-like protein
MAHAITLHSGVLDLAELFPAGPAAPRRAPWVIALGVAAILALAAATWARTDGFGSSRTADETLRIPLEEQRFVASLNVDDKAELLALGTDAAARNAAIPVSALPLEQVGRFSLAAQAANGTYPTALRCLTQAVYYEAAVEPLQGRRAVAQVVLNRMRHPAYPHSVCGVVYQGSERRTGCQFSFTCDGSLLRAPSAGPWREAEAIARAALAGQSEPSVGTATHYHADYVLPKWAFQLGKIGQIGRHIFYRFAGGWGRSSALNAAYSGREAIPALNLAALRERLEDGAVPLGEASEAFVPGLTVTPADYDRHALSDVGGRLDTTKEWRLTIPDPVTASSRYRAALGQAGGGQAGGGQAGSEPGAEGTARAAASTGKEPAVTAAPAAGTAPVAALGTQKSGHEVALK